MSRARTIRQRARAAAVIERLAALLPHTLAVFEGKRVPLALGIHNDLIALSLSQERLRATHEGALAYCAFADLKRFAVDLA
jgi:hypothetical protein